MRRPRPRASPSCTAAGRPESSKAGKEFVKSVKRLDWRTAPARSGDSARGRAPPRPARGAPWPSCAGARTLLARGGEHPGGRTMRHASLAAAAAVLASLSGGAAYAQEETGQFRTALSVVGGLSVGSSRAFGLRDGRGGFGGRDGSGFTVGGGLAHDFSSRLTLEAT